MKKNKISIVLGTYNRIKFLKLTIDSIREEFKHSEIPHEIIVVDGGSSDKTINWLTKQKDIITIIQHNHGTFNGKKIERKSWGYFMNLGFKSAQGKYICMISDDCLIVPNAIINGYNLFEKKLASNEKIGAVAFYWRDWPIEKQYKVYKIANKYTTLNHGIYLNQALKDVNYIDDTNFNFYHADSDLCLRMFQKKYKCLDSPDSFIEHYNHANKIVRKSNTQKEKGDNLAFFKKWGHLFSGSKITIGVPVKKYFADDTAIAKKFKKYYFKYQTYLFFRKIYRQLQAINNKFKNSPSYIHFLQWLILKIKILFKIKFSDKRNDTPIEQIDVVIPTISKDYEMLNASIKSLKNVCHSINKIFIVSQKDSDIIELCNDKGYIFIDEKTILGYGKEKINYRVNDLDRSGWLFQQLLKLAGDKITEKENFLVIDSDTILLNKHSFINKNKFIFTQSSVEYHKPYFDAFEKIFKEKAPNKLSNTCHMMIYNGKKLKEMREEIEKIHNKKWDDVIISTKDIDKNEKSCFAECETYPNWLLLRYPNQVSQKPFYNLGISRKEFTDIDTLTKKFGDKYNSLSFHSYIK